MNGLGLVARYHCELKNGEWEVVVSPWPAGLARVQKYLRPAHPGTAPAFPFSGPTDWMHPSWLAVAY